tara:strand:+ start:850 stop:1119 length:270 start_codon:yes stop_codon:yes gene_type:complete
MKRKSETLSDLLHDLSISKKQKKESNQQDVLFYNNVFETKGFIVKSSYTFNDVCNILNKHDEELQEKLKHFLETNVSTLEQSNPVVRVK